MLHRRIGLVSATFHVRDPYPFVVCFVLTCRRIESEKGAATSHDVGHTAMTSGASHGDPARYESSASSLSAKTFIEMCFLRARWARGCETRWRVHPILARDGPGASDEPGAVAVRRQRNQLDQPMIGDDCDDHSRKSVHSISQPRRPNNPKVLCSTRASCDVGTLTSEPLVVRDMDAKTASA